MRKCTASAAIAAGLTIIERPGPQFSGRKDDVDQPYKAVRTSRLKAPIQAPEVPLSTPLWRIPPQERRKLLSARTSAAADAFTSSWETAHGNVKVADRIKFYTGTCTECSQSFTVSRPASRRGKWPSVCGDECKKIRQRRQGAARVRKHRDLR